MHSIKNTLPLILILVIGITTTEFSYGQKSELIASCCVSKEGRCTGSSYCTACRNCSRCRHCSGGGSCGVCSGGYRSTARTNKSYNYKRSNTHNKSYSTRSSKQITNKSSTVNSYSNDVSSAYYLKSLWVNAQSLNLRNGPGASYTVIERLKKGQKLTFLKMIGNWVKVKVKSTMTIGYVHYKYVLVEE